MSAGTRTPDGDSSTSSIPATDLEDRLRDLLAGALRMSGQEVGVAYDGDGALSGSTETGARENSLAAGFAHHLAKPVDLEVVNRLLAARCGPFVHDDAGGV